MGDVCAWARRSALTGPAHGRQDPEHCDPDSGRSHPNVRRNFSVVGLTYVLTKLGRGQGELSLKGRHLLSEKVLRGTSILRPPQGGNAPFYSCSQ